MHIQINRYYGYAVPLGILVAAVCGRFTGALMLFMTLLAGQCASLAASESFRAASAKLISQKKLLFSSFLAFVMLLAGHGALYFVAKGLPMARSMSLTGWLTVAFELNFLRLTVETASAQSDQTSALLGDVLGGLIAALSLLLGENAPAQIQYAEIGLIPLLLLMLGMTFRAQKAQPSARVLAEIPRGLLRSLLFPLVYLMVMAAKYLWMGEMPRVGDVLGLYAGCAALELCRSTFRRSEAESHGLNGILSAAMVVLAMGTAACRLMSGPWTARMEGIFRGILMAGGCSLLLYSKFEVRTAVGALLMIAPAAAACFIPDLMLIADALTVPALVCMVPDFVSLHRTARAMRIRARAQKARRG